MITHTSQYEHLPILTPPKPPEPLSILYQPAAAAAAMDKSTLPPTHTPNSDLTPQQLKERKALKKRVKEQAKAVKKARNKEFRKAMTERSKPPPPSLYISDKVRSAAERTVQLVSTSLFSDSFSSSSEDRKAREQGGGLLKLMTANKFDDDDMEVRVKQQYPSNRTPFNLPFPSSPPSPPHSPQNPLALWGYTRHKFSKRALLTFDSLRLLEKYSLLPTFLPTPPSSIISIGEGPSNDLLGALTFLTHAFPSTPSSYTCKGFDNHSAQWSEITLKFNEGEKGRL